MRFDDERLLSLTRDIGRYLGYLKGNELVRTYLDAQVADAEDQAMATEDAALYALNSNLYTSTPEEPEFACDFNALQVWVPFPGTDDPTPESRRVYRDIAEAMEQSWENGGDWARGMGADLRAICKPFTEPDPGRLNDIAARLMSISVGSLAGLLPDDFASDSRGGLNFASTLGNWEGPAADTFETFYNNLSDRGEGYAFCIALASGWVAAAAALIAAAQTGVLDVLESVRDRLKIQLEEWAETNGNPQDWREPADWGWIGDIAEVATDIADLIPLVDEIPEGIREAGELIRKLDLVFTKVNEYLGGGEIGKKKARTDFSVESAEDLFMVATDVLYNEIYSEFREGLANLADKSRDGIRMLQTLEDGGAWMPHELQANTFSSPWKHNTD